VGVAFGVFLGCAGPAVAVAPERHPAESLPKRSRRLWMTTSASQAMQWR
jgi:hypothetical protein